MKVQSKRGRNHKEERYSQNRSLLELRNHKEERLSEPLWYPGRWRWNKGFEFLSID